MSGLAKSHLDLLCGVAEALVPLVSEVLEQHLGPGGTGTGVG